MFGRATIRLGIGPHSSLVCFVECNEICTMRDWCIAGLIGILVNFGPLPGSTNFQQQISRTLLVGA